VAKKLGRRFAGFELSEKYAAEAHKRLLQTSAGDGLNGAENSLTSAPRTGENHNAARQQRSRRRVGADAQGLFPVEDDAAVSAGESTR